MIVNPRSQMALSDRFLFLPMLVILLFLLQACPDMPSFTLMRERSNPAHAIRSEATRIADISGHDFKLSDDRWQHRLVLVFAPSDHSPEYRNQMQAWQADAAGVKERDLKLVEVMGTGESRVDGQPIRPASAEALRRQFGITPEQFATILVGKDGTEKQRSQTPVNLAGLFQTIDAMPMRQQEMRSRQ